MTKTQLIDFIKDYYGVTGDNPWQDDNIVFRHKHNKKWFALVMDIPKCKLGLSEEGSVSAVNLKCDTMLIGTLTQEKGIFKGYHMNKNHWITVCLDGSVEEERVKYLVDLSFDLRLKGQIRTSL